MRASTSPARSKLAELTVRDIMEHTDGTITTGQVIEKVAALFWGIGLPFTDYNRGEVLDWIRLVGPQCKCPGT